MPQVWSVASPGKEFKLSVAPCPNRRQRIESRRKHVRKVLGEMERNGCRMTWGLECSCKVPVRRKSQKPGSPGFGKSATRVSRPRSPQPLDFELEMARRGYSPTKTHEAPGSAQVVVAVGEAYVRWA